MIGRWDKACLGGFLLLLFLALSLLLTFPIDGVPFHIQGHVRDHAGPVPKARVRYKGDSQFVLTDESGRFRLPWREGDRAVTAGKEGYVIAGCRADQFPLSLRIRRLPTDDFEEYAWVDPGPGSGAHNCANCHGEIYREWSASGHARSVRNRRFLNLYEGSDWHGRPGVGWSLLTEHPDGSGVCTSCHAPTVSFQDAAYYDLRKTRGVAERGVHCDYCHKIAAVDNDRIGLTHGRFGLKLLRPAEGQLFFGPLDDVDRGDDSFAPLYRQSQYCASCHEGTVFGVPVYTTYSEWLASPARREGKECQTCHMAPTGTLTNLAPGKGGIERDPSLLSSHRFAGGQEEMLRRCLQVAVTFHPDREGVRAVVAVRADDVGHRVPTGFIDRHLLLVVEPLGSAGQRLSMRSGPILPALAGPELAGLPGRLHAKLLSDGTGRAPAPFWRAVSPPRDTRLFPGRAERAEFGLPPAAVNVRVRLLYRRFWDEVARSKDWPDNEVTVVDRLVEVGVHR